MEAFRSHSFNILSSFASVRLQVFLFKDFLPDIPNNRHKSVIITSVSVSLYTKHTFI